MDPLNSRRTFIRNTAMAATTTLFSPRLSLFEAPHEKEGDGLTFLFQGDSITDGGRGREGAKGFDNNHMMGQCYAYLISSRIGYEHPEKNLTFYNRGWSGSRVNDLANHWQKDALDLKPDVLSILVGVNDANSVINKRNTVTASDYETMYRALLQQTRDALPNVQLILCEPFVLPVGAAKENWNVLSAEITKRQETVRKLATEFGTMYVALQSLFNDACKKAPAEYWIWDGVHPMPAGHELIARAWLKTVGKKIRVVRG